jgi:hypothetical protein
LDKFSKSFSFPNNKLYNPIKRTINTNKMAKAFTDFHNHRITQGIYRKDPESINNPHANLRPIYVYQEKGTWMIEEYTGKIKELTHQYSFHLKRIPVSEINDAVFISHILEKRGKLKPMLEKIVNKENSKK